MNETFFFLTIGCLLIAILLFLFRETASRRERLPDGDRDILPKVSAPSETGERILGPADWDYVYENASPEVQRLFCAERRRLALLWLCEVRRTSRALFRVHRTQSSRSDGIRTSLELKLLFDYFVLRVSCELATFVVLFSTPAALRTAARWTDGMTNRFREAAESASRNERLA